MSAPGRLVALALFATGCGARATPAPAGHVRVRLDTDAPLPSRAARPLDDDAPIPLFDTLRVEIVREDGSVCAECLRETEASTETFAEGASFTVTGARGERVRLHVLLHRRAAALGGALSPGLEAWVTLPPVPAEGGVDAPVFLPTDSFARPSGTRAAPRAPDPPFEGTRVGTWARARRTGCGSAPPPGMACVPGGAFLAGDPTLIGRADADADEPHLIVLSPFFVDRHEVDGKAYRALGPSTAALLRWSGSELGDDVHDWCTYTDAPGPRDDRPVNCVPQKAARAHCLARGADLPTEAQFEYLAGGMRGRRFPWGDDLPACEDAVWGRAGYPSGPPEISAYAGACRPRTGVRADVLGVPLPVDAAGGRRRDVVVLGGLEVRDLAGNLAEWMRDAFQPQSGPCFHPEGTAVLVDPVCAFLPGSTGASFAVRGGSIVHAPREAAGAVRTRQLDGAYLHVGFRCVTRV